MRRVQVCQSCLGRYPRVQRDGSVYLHACAPVGVDKDGQPVEHPKKRDENIRVAEDGRRVGIIAEGEGAEELEEV